MLMAVDILMVMEVARALEEVIKRKVAVAMEVA
jgi:hypothetical protein